MKYIENFSFRMGTLVLLRHFSKQVAINEMSSMHSVSQTLVLVHYVTQNIPFSLPVCKTQGCDLLKNMLLLIFNLFLGRCCVTFFDFHSSEAKIIVRYFKNLGDGDLICATVKTIPDQK